jgi:hypothetical protein
LENPAAKGAIEMSCKIMELIGSNKELDKNEPYSQKINECIRQVYPVSLASVQDQIVSNQIQRFLLFFKKKLLNLFRMLSWQDKRGK